MSLTNLADVQHDRGLSSLSKRIHTDAGTAINQLASSLALLSDQAEDNLASRKADHG